MQTHCFIGSDKNCGKTTAFTHVYEKMHRRGRDLPLCVTTIGINGEGTDRYGGGAKPEIRLLKGSSFITRGRHLSRHGGKYETTFFMSGGPFRGSYVMGRCLMDFPVVLEGPNSGGEVRLMKEKMAKLFPEQGVLLIDGSIDRQFLAHPAISDMFYFSVLFSKRRPQRRKSKGLLQSLQIDACADGIRKIITAEQGAATKSLLFREDGRVLYHSNAIPYCDDGLLRACREVEGRVFLYLNGAFTGSLNDFLMPFKDLELVLDNFTLYQKISTSRSDHTNFQPRITLLHPLRIRGVFVKQEVDFDRNLLPAGVPVKNLFRCGGGGNEP